MARIVTKYVTGNGSRGGAERRRKAGAASAAPRLRVKCLLKSVGASVVSSAAEADDVAVGILDVEVLRAPGGGREWLEDRHAVRDALFVESFDAVDARRRVEMLVFAAVLSRRLVLGRLFQVKFESIQVTDGVEAIPRLAEREA